MGCLNSLGDVIILAGGFGTRLQSISGGLPKSLMPVGDRVFLDFVLDHLIHAGVKRVFLSLHYRAEAFSTFVRRRSHDIELVVNIEREPMGTGGAVSDVILARDVGDEFMVLNGDTYFSCDPAKLWQEFLTTDTLAMLGLTEVAETNRYGAVETVDGRILSMSEKASVGGGYINIGMYVFSRQAFEDMNGKFSLELDLFPKLLADNQLRGYKFQKADFIDIGIPTDYRKFCNLVRDNHV